MKNLGEGFVQVAPWATQISGRREAKRTVYGKTCSQVPVTLDPMCLPSFQGEARPERPSVCTFLAAPGT